METLMLGGSVALSIDTSVFERSGNRLEGGVLKHLEQFKGQRNLLLTEVVRNELRAHMVKQATESLEALKHAVKSTANWLNDESERTDAVRRLTGDGNAEALVDKRIKDFVKRCGVVAVPAKLAPMDEVVHRYFAAKAPFEDSAKKKSEFPDAIALLSIEKWAEKNSTPVIVVSADSGWKAYAEASDTLCHIEDLSEALSMFQTLDERRRKLVEDVAAFIDDNPRWDGFDRIRDDLIGIDWEVVAFSMYNFDVDLEVDVESVSLLEDSAGESLSLIDFDGTILTVTASLQAHLRVDVTFSFSLDGVHLGSLVESPEHSVPFQAVLMLTLTKGEDPELVHVEIERLQQRLEFGDVQPDYSNEMHDYD